MRNILSLTKKELNSFFFSPFAYVLSAMFVGIIGWLFFNYLILAKSQQAISIQNHVIAPIFGNMNFLLLFLSPLITMRLLAEEKKQGTLDLLLSSNLNELQIIIAKLLSAFLIVTFMVSLTLVFPFILGESGYENWSVILTGYVGILLSALSYLSIGLFASSLTQNQIVSALLSFCFLFGLMLFVLTANAVTNPLVGEIFQYFSVAFHYEAFSRGVFKSYNFVYYFSIVAMAIYLTKKKLEARKW